jgi:hypothetical protein
MYSVLQADVAVTVYNDNRAVVREVRELEFELGTLSYKFTDVAARIDPTSVHFKSLTAPSSVQLLEQNYEYDLVGTDRLLQKYVDEQIVVTTKEGNVHTGELLNSEVSDVILSTPDGRVNVIKASELATLEFPSLPMGLNTKPTLIWLLDCQKPGKHDCEISYITSGLKWHAEYVAVIDENDKKMDLSSWVSIDNQSGTAYNNAKLKLVAGDVHIVRPKPPTRLMKAEMAAAEAPQFEEKSFFEYHLYTLQRRTTLNDRQIKQVSLFPESQVNIDKKYVFDGKRDDKVKVVLEFMNSEKNGLGIPLPEGKIRAYKKDSDGSQEFIGEDQIDHTPRDEKVRVNVGNAFDVVGERTVKNVDKISQNSRKETVEIKVRNHKDKAISVTVVEHMWGDWSFMGQTPKVLKKQARRVEFLVPVPKHEETVIQYTVLIQY